MKRYPETLRAILFTATLALPGLVQSAAVDLATTPLATSTTSTVKPNVLFIIDNSGSMSWDHMPDDDADPGSNVTFDYGYYGMRSSQCNQAYYDPDITYDPPLDANGDAYTDSVFTNAEDNGFDTSGSNVDLDSAFKANQSNISGNAGGTDPTGLSAYYYAYSGTQDTALEKNYHSTSSTFYNECHSAINTSPGQDVFTKRRLASTMTTTIALGCSSCSSSQVTSITVNGTQLLSSSSGSTTTVDTMGSDLAGKITLNGYSASYNSSSNILTITGPASAANYTPVITKSGSMTLTPDVFPETDSTKRTNFANWYSYYRTRMLMMKTAAGRAFSELNNSYRVGLMKISQTNPVLGMDTFEEGHRDSWYSSLYGMGASGSTPLRRSLSDAGRYFAGRLSVTDPIQYSCQQNFAILSTDGYWNTGDGVQIDGTTTMDNQDTSASRPMYDGSITLDTWTNTYTRNNYSTSTSGCSSGKRKLKTQPEIGTCTVASDGASCTPSSASNNGSATYGSCQSSVTVPSPDPSVWVLQSSVQNSSGGSSGSLADVAMYYYQTDLRTSDLSNCTGVLGDGEDVCENNVFTSSTDNNIQQHMTTFTLSMGVSGKMNYSSSYLSDTATTSDYVAVKLGSTASAADLVCTWQTDGSVCNWPVPGMVSSDGKIENIDDLWHAAVNGRGAYFSATDPETLASGLSNALSGINARQGSAAAAATSTLNPVAGNNYAFVASYTTVKWHGNLEARGINVDTGEVNENASWCIEDVTAGACTAPGAVEADTSGSTTAYFCVTPDSVTCPNGTLDGTNCRVPVATSCTGTLKSRVTDATDSRVIKTANSSGSGLVDFTYDNLTASQQAYFGSSTIDALNQWSALTTTQRTAAAGANLVNYLRGQTGFEVRDANDVDNRLYRYREATLGDALESQPSFISKPVFSYPYPGYTAYKTAQASRGGTVYMGANDGMMHAFNADTGAERWAYVPSMVMPNLWKLADTSYNTLHTNYVNGSPITSDICSANCTDEASAVWKTILVAGLNGGGRGYYALDITDPDSPALLWEFTTTAGLGAASGYDDDNVGYSFGKPVITRKSDGTWVVLVTSGYNNTSPGDGEGYLYVLNAASGAIISKIATDTGSTTTPSGLTQISAWNEEPAGNKVGYVYGGDLLGNVWRFDINSPASAAIGTGSVMKFAALYSDDAATSPQPITVAPVLGKIVGKRVVFIGTGKYLENGDLTDTQTQSIYAIKDDDATTTLTNPRTTLVEQTIIDNPDGTASRVAGTSNTVNFYTGRGWYVDFPDSGERVNIDMILVSGTLLVPTTVPSNTVCSPGGYGWLNFIDYKTGGAVNLVNDLVSTKYDAPIVGVNVIYVQGDPKVGVVTASDPTPTLDEGVEFSASAAGFSGKRVIWRELIP